MFIDNETKLRVNIYRPYKGFSKLTTPEIRQRAGVVEIPDPVPPDDFSEETYYSTEQDDAPYVVYTKKSDEQLAAIRWNKLKQIRDELQEAGCPVDDKWFHNDIKSRSQWERMANRAKDMQPTDPYVVNGVQVAWKTMDGSFVLLTAEKILQVVDAFESREVLIFTVAETKRYDDSPINEGWPERYNPEPVEEPAP
jgi:hypothetical protein